MYLDHFKLIRKPFNISSDPDFLWLGHCHGMALSALSRAVDRGGIMVLTGDVGTGKTTLLNTIVQGLPARVRTARIVDPCLELHQFFPAMAQDLGGELQRDEPFDTAFARFLETVLLSKEHCLVIVDEAQRISPIFLKALFSWQDLGNGRLPLTVFLVGQNEFAGALSTLEGGRFLEKITLHQVLVPLNRKETADYVQYRMSNAGAGEEVFLETALDKIFVFSKGYPRVINSLCDRCLVVAHRQGSMVVDESLVQSAARQILLPHEPDPFSAPGDDTGEPPGPGRRFLPMVAALAVFIVSVLVPTLLFDDFRNSGFPEAGIAFDDPGAYSGPGSGILPVSDSQGRVQTVVGEVVKSVESPVLDPLKAPGSAPAKLSGDRIRFRVVEGDDPVREVPDPGDRTRPEAVEGAAPGREAPDPGDVIIWLLERRRSGQ